MALRPGPVHPPGTNERGDRRPGIKPRIVKSGTGKRNVERGAVKNRRHARLPAQYGTVANALGSAAGASPFGVPFSLMGPQLAHSATRDQPRIDRLHDRLVAEQQIQADSLANISDAQERLGQRNLASLLSGPRSGGPDVGPISEMPAASAHMAAQRTTPRYAMQAGSPEITAAGQGIPSQGTLLNLARLPNITGGNLQDIAHTPGVPGSSPFVSDGPLSQNRNVRFTPGDVTSGQPLNSRSVNTGLGSRRRQQIAAHRQQRAEQGRSRLARSTGGSAVAGSDEGASGRETLRTTLLNNELDSTPPATIADASTQSDLNASTLFEQVDSGERSLDEALRQAETLDQDAPAGVSVLSKLQELLEEKQRREAAEETRLNIRRQAPIAAPFGMMF